MWFVYLAGGAKVKWNLVSRAIGLDLRQGRKYWRRLLRLQRLAPFNGLRVLDRLRTSRCAFATDG